MKQVARIIRNNVPLTLLSNGLTYCEPLSVSTVADARLLPDPPPQTIIINAFGTFYWSAASIAADDGATIIKVTAVTTGRYLLMANGTVTVVGVGSITPSATNNQYIATVGGLTVWATATGGGTVLGTGRSIATSLPLTGGGTLASDLTIGVNDATTAAVGVVKLALDLGGTALLPTVVAVTGAAGVAPIKCSATVAGYCSVGAQAAKVYSDSYGAFGATYSGVWLGTITPALDNVALVGDGTSTIINGLTRVQVAEDGVVNATLTSDGLRIGDTNDPTERAEVVGNVKIARDTASKIFQQDNTTNLAIASDLTIQGPNATGTSSSGGALVLTGGTGTSSHAGVKLQHGGSTKLQTLSTGAAITGDGTATGDFLANSGANGKARLAGLVGATATRGALYLGNVTASTTNAVLNSDGSELIIQAPGNNPIYFRSNDSGNNLGRLDSTGLRIGDHSAPGAKLDAAGNCILGTTTSAHQIVGSQRWTVRTLAAGLVIDTTTTDMIILVDTSAARAITLPAATAGRVIIIKDKTGTAGTNNITITRAGSESIEGIAANYVMATNWGRLTLACDGTNWFIC